MLSNLGPPIQRLHRNVFHYISGVMTIFATLQETGFMPRHITRWESFVIVSPLSISPGQTALNTHMFTVKYGTH